MSKLSACLLLIFLLAVILFGTWQLFLGNFEAAFSTLPFLVIIYFFLMERRR